jgi:hypothetical protein
MKKLFVLLAAALMVSLSGSIALGQSVSKETRNVSGFTGVGFGVAGELTIKIGRDFSVVLEGDSKYLTEVETVVRNGKLQIYRQNYRGWDNEKMKVYITMPELQSLGLSGSGRATVADPVKTSSLGLNVSGSGKIFVGDVNAEELHCGISGSGDIFLTGNGEAAKGDISISGSGNYTGDNVRIKELRISVSGSGNCSCYVTEALSAGISGSGNVTYSGSPKLDVRASGSGHVRSK